MGGENYRLLRQGLPFSLAVVIWAHQEEEKERLTAGLCEHNTAFLEDHRSIDRKSCGIEDKRGVQITLALDATSARVIGLHTKGGKPGCCFAFMLPLERRCRSFIPVSLRPGRSGCGLAPTMDE
jgi:hypothetical protein